MPKFKYQKLVRDKIVETQIAEGSKPMYRKLNDTEHKVELIKKIIEEASEIANADPKKIASEIADVQQALDDLKEKYNLTDEDIAKVQQAKNDRFGAFKLGLFVEEIEIDENNTWTAYYRQNPNRYPEVVEKVDH